MCVAPPWSVSIIRSRIPATALLLLPLVLRIASIPSLWTAAIWLLGILMLLLMPICRRGWPLLVISSVMTLLLLVRIAIGWRRWARG